MRILKTILYWVVQCTWGVIMTLIGSVVAAICLITKHKPKRFGKAVYFVIGKNWGGISLGGFFFISASQDDMNTKTHEYGHTIQNLLLGPLFPFIVGIPSASRCQLFNLHSDVKRKKYSILFPVITIGVSLICFVASICVLSFTSFVNLGRTLTIITSTLVLYASIISLWINCFEYPNLWKHDYYSVWFERTASSIGGKLVDNRDF